MNKLCEGDKKTCICKRFFKYLKYVVVYLIAINLLYNFIDYGQSTRRCGTIYPDQKDTIRGIRITLLPFVADYSFCFHKTLFGRKNVITKRYSKIEEEYFCGKDLKSYKVGSETSKDIEVLHSGFCGKCSNDQDIEIMKVTRMNLTGTAKYCGFMLLAFGDSAAMRCMEKHVGFTDGCNRCWVDNMGCSITHCFFTCIWSIMIGEQNNKLGDRDINSCLRCDEENCGQMFLECSGANRRKCGITTDIERPDDELWKGKC